MPQDIKTWSLSNYHLVRGLQSCSLYPPPNSPARQFIQAVLRDQVLLLCACPSLCIGEFQLFKRKQISSTPTAETSRQI